MTMYRPKVYVASKLRHARLWRSLWEDEEWRFVHWTASWVDRPEVEQELRGQPVDPDVYEEAWLQNLRDIKGSDFVLLYAGNEEALRGALIEAGAAIALGITVVAVGLNADHNWSCHPEVRNFSSLRKARDYLYQYTIMAPLRTRQGIKSDD